MVAMGAVAIHVCVQCSNAVKGHNAGMEVFGTRIVTAGCDYLQKTVEPLRLAAAVARKLPRT